MHGGDEESSRPATWVEHAVVWANLGEFGEERRDVLGGKDDAEALSVAAAVAYELAIETAEDVLRRIVVDCAEDV